MMPTEARNVFIGFRVPVPRAALLGAVLLAMAGGVGVGVGVAAEAGSPATPFPTLSKESETCSSCHKEGGEAPLHKDMKTDTKHGAANVGCYECHRPQSGGPEGVEHYGLKMIAIVPYSSCTECHPR
ncbi:MAG: hypothetical protein H7840_06665 [Alphaproteobacteria bacterium]